MGKIQSLPHDSFYIMNNWISIHVDNGKSVYEDNGISVHDEKDGFF
jgi:hypothetical protein